MQKTHIGGMAEIAGSNPASGTYSYATDNVGSPWAVYDQSKAVVAELDYTPYGQAYTANDTIGITHRYTGHDWDATAALYFAPYRFYNPQIARWMSRDPLGMVDGPNVYLYVGSRPMNRIDALGLLELLTFDGTNPHQHCANSCVLAKWFGQDVSRRLMDVGKEILDVVICLTRGRPDWRDWCDSAFQPSDFRDNATGRKCAKDACTKGSDTEGESCKKCCTRNGVGPDTPEGPGTDRPYGPLSPIGD